MGNQDNDYCMPYWAIPNYIRPYTDMDYLIDWNYSISRIEKLFLEYFNISVKQHYSYKNNRYRNALYYLVDNNTGEILHKYLSKQILGQYLDLEKLY